MFNFPSAGGLGPAETIEERLVAVQGANMKNEMRVAYLTEEFARLNETHVHDVKATYNKNELKMR